MFVPDALPRQTEAQWQRKVVAYARLMGWRVWHDNATNAPKVCRSCKAPLKLPRNAAGWPDLVLVRRPRVLFVELKAERTPTTADQRAWLADLHESGMQVRLWRPSDWPEVERVLL